MKDNNSYLPNYDNAIQELRSWRERYSADIYPQKILSNALYRLFSVGEVYNLLVNSFYKKRIPIVTDYDSARNLVSSVFKKIKIEQISPQLDALITESEDIADFNIAHYQNIVQKALNFKDNKSIEELEFVYIYYSISTEYLFRWFALGMNEYSKDDALAVISGRREAILNKGGSVSGENIDSFKKAMQVISMFGTSQFMNLYYSELAPFY